MPKYNINDLILTVQDICNIETETVTFTEVEHYISEYGIEYSEGKKAIESFLTEYYSQ